MPDPITLILYSSAVVAPVLLPDPAVLHAVRYAVLSIVACSDEQTPLSHILTRGYPVNLLSKSTG